MSNSTTILTANTHPGDSTTETITGEKFKGDGYYGRADGFHTVQYNLLAFNGTIKMQGTLAVTPTDNDWFDITNTDVTGSDGNFFKNFTGNFVWVRVLAVYTSGAVNSVLLNH
jgi:hypothetical protein